MAKIKHTDNTHADEDAKKVDHSYTAGGNLKLVQLLQKKTGKV